MASVVAAVLGVSYAAVPLYKVFCQARIETGEIFVTGRKHGNCILLRHRNFRPIEALILS